MRDVAAVMGDRGAPRRPGAAGDPLERATAEPVRTPITDPPGRAVKTI
jgi:hypothetical protein